MGWNGNYAVMSGDGNKRVWEWQRMRIMPYPQADL